MTGQAIELFATNVTYVTVVNTKFILHRFEEAFITTQIKGAEKHLWIGMNSKHGSFFWADNTPSNYFKWNTREPGWGWNRCVEIVPYHWAAGRWNAPYCSKLNGYICKKGLFRSTQKMNSIIIWNVGLLILKNIVNFKLSCDFN